MQNVHSTTPIDIAHPYLSPGIHSVPAVQIAAAVDNSSYPTVDQPSLASPAPVPLEPVGPAPGAYFDSVQPSG